MKPLSTKKPSPIDETTLRDDEIDELLDEAEDESSTMAASSPDASGTEAQDLLSRIAQLEGQLDTAENARMLAFADYQNLQRRTLADRAMWSKLATQDLVTSIIEPLEHLQRAAEQLNDAGLTMVVKQLFEKLEEHGLKKIDSQGQAFDAVTMEAIAGSNPEGKKVTSVISNGYTLSGVLIQPAKVKVG